MGNEDFSPLEKTLRRHAPAQLPDALRQDLERCASGTGAAKPATTPLADRILAFWTATGALAACFVAALTLWQVTAVPRPSPASPQEMALRQQTQIEYEKLIASR